MLDLCGAPHISRFADMPTVRLLRGVSRALQQKGTELGPVPYGEFVVDVQVCAHRSVRHVRRVAYLAVGQSARGGVSDLLPSAAGNDPPTPARPPARVKGVPTRGLDRLLGQEER